MTELPPDASQPESEVQEVKYLPYDFDPALKEQIQSRSHGGRVLSFLVSEWRDAIMAAAEHPGDKNLIERTTVATDAVEDMLHVLNVQRTEQRPPSQE